MEQTARFALAAFTFVLLTGWQPHSRAYVPPTHENDATRWSCSCLGVPSETRPADAMLQRRSFLPDVPAKPEPGCAPAQRAAAPSSAAEALRALFATRIDASTCDQHAADEPADGTIHPEFAGRHRALGPILLGLVPLIWHAALRHPVNTSTVRTRVLAPALRGLVVRVPSGANNLFDHIPFADR